MQHGEAQRADSQVTRDLIHLLDQLGTRAHATRTCKHCGAVMTVFDAVFFLENGDRSWNVPMPICLNCEPTLDLSKCISPKAA